MKSFSALINLKVVRKWRSPFFSIKNFNSHNAVVEFFFSFKSCKSFKKVTKFFFSGHVSLSFHMMHKFPGTIFSLPGPSKFLWSKQYFNLHEERRRTHFSKYCKSYFPAVQINGSTYVMSEATVPSFPSSSCSEHFRKCRWKSPYVNNDCLWKLSLCVDFLCLFIQLIN